ncbi:SID1 transmembrane family member 2 [Orchesella cincta]|uniref:SID1 transmembrane family member 2 n=1 Tax=Orchesella cincta TaxID=48709 RepID=A0A1D2N8N3_ORCCI|nr:SID1 transmembrane family member 2 [Orchesella cincta]
MLIKMCQIKLPAFQLLFYAETEELNNLTESYPLLATVFWHGAVRSWEIPIHFISGDNLKRMNRFSDDIIGKTLWHYPVQDTYDSWNLTVRFRTFNDILIYYKMKIIPLPDFLVKREAKITGTATPSSPSIYMFRDPIGLQDENHLFIEVLSSTDVCALLSVQKLQGPFLDKIDSHNEMVFFQTFTLKTGLTIRRDFPDGFLLVFYPFSNDKKCKKPRDQNITLTNNMFRKKDFAFVIRNGFPFSSYPVALMAPVVMILLFGFVILIVQSKFHQMRRRLLAGDVELSPIERKHSVYKSHIKISDLVIDEPRLWQTGDYDICYINHYCSHMLGPVHDFNHIYSNIGYYIFGLLYAKLVRNRQIEDHSSSVPKSSDEEQTSRPPFGLWPGPGARRCSHNHEKGVCNHYSLLYCLAFTQFMTGVMSAGYHICPNQSNFQFDTVFMYTIAAITIVTLYQFRHPTYLSANFTFAALALVACITVLGLLWEQRLVRTAFTSIHMIFLILSLPKICFNGYVRKNGHLVHHYHEMMPILYAKFKDDFRNGRLFQFQHSVWRAPDDPEIVVIPGPGRLLLPGFFLILNTVSMVAIWTFLEELNFATQWHHGECRRRLFLQPLSYLICATTLWIVAMYFFLDEVSSWETSPAESRLQNKDCILLGFYDSHDLWHFFSSAALFCSSMTLLTVDDDLVDQPVSTIVVF